MTSETSCSLKAGVRLCGPVRLYESQEEEQVSVVGAERKSLNSKDPVCATNHYSLKHRRPITLYHAYRVVYRTWEEPHQDPANSIHVLAEHFSVSGSLTGFSAATENSPESCTQCVQTVLYENASAPIAAETRRHCRFDTKTGRDQDLNPPSSPESRFCFYLSWRKTLGWTSRQQPLCVGPFRGAPWSERCGLPTITYVTKGTGTLQHAHNTLQLAVRRRRTLMPQGSAWTHLQTRD